MLAGSRLRPLDEHGPSIGRTRGHSHVPDCGQELHAAPEEVQICDGQGVLGDWRPLSEPIRSPRRLGAFGKLTYVKTFQPRWINVY